MADLESRRIDLEALTVRFTEAFNRDDLGEVLSMMTEDAVYDQFGGEVARGKESVREALAPQFAGRFGAVRFEAEDLFVDPAAEKVLVRWVCSIAKDGRTRVWRGLDLLHFEGSRVKEKHTYAKAERLRLEER
jgi:ketosteroid isomerase-like protein